MSHDLHKAFSLVKGAMGKICDVEGLEDKEKGEHGQKDYV